MVQFFNATGPDLTSVTVLLCNAASPNQSSALQYSIAQLQNVGSRTTGILSAAATCAERDHNPLSIKNIRCLGHIWIKVVDETNKSEGTDLRERVAAAIFHAQRKQEIERISNVTFDKSAFDQAVSKILTAEPEISVLTGWALISTHIDRAVRHHVSHGTDREMEDFFSGFGPLSTDAGKIKLAKMMGWLPKDLFDALSFVRRTRNKLAHQLHTPAEVSHLIRFPRTKFSFADQTILKGLSALTAAETDVGDGIDFVNELGSLRYAQISMIILASRSFESILNGPGALALGVDFSGWPLYTYDEAPEWAKSLRLSTADAIIRIMP